MNKNRMKVFLTTISISSFLFLSAYHAAIYCTVRAIKNPVIVLEKTNEEITTQQIQVRKWIRLAKKLAPGAYDQRYLYGMIYFNSYSLQDLINRWKSGEEPFDPDGIHSVIDGLKNDFPYDPNSLFLRAQFAIDRKRIQEAIELLEHAVRNDPDFEQAKKLLFLIKEKNHDNL